MIVQVSVKESVPPRVFNETGTLVTCTHFFAPSLCPFLPRDLDFGTLPSVADLTSVCEVELGCSEAFSLVSSL